MYYFVKLENGLLCFLGSIATKEVSKERPLTTFTFLHIYRVLRIPTGRWVNLAIPNCGITAVTVNSTMSRINFVGSYTHLFEANLHFN